MNKKHFKKMTENEFKTLRSLVDAGVKRIDLCKAMGRSYFTITEIQRAKTFEEYKGNIKAYNQKYSGNHKSEKVSTDDTVKTKFTIKSNITQMVDLLQQMKDLLVTQSRTLHNLEELWEYPADYFKQKNLEAIA